MQRRQRALIFDVDAGLLTNLKRILENAGLESSTTCDAGLAPHLVAERQCDLFILCSNLQHGQAERMVSAIHRSCPNCKCMVLDGLDESRGALGQLQSGVDVTSHCANCGVDLTPRQAKQCEFCHKLHCKDCADCHTVDCDEQLGPIARMLGY